MNGSLNVNNIYISIKYIIYLIECKKDQLLDIEKKKIITSLSHPFWIWLVLSTMHGCFRKRFEIIVLLLLTIKYSFWNNSEYKVKIKIFNAVFILAI